MADESKLKVIWMITERGEKSHWTRIGSGHVNRDGSISLVFEAFPVGNAKIQVRDFKPREEE